MRNEKFELAIANVPSSWREALIAVADTAVICNDCLTALEKPFNVSDVVAMTKLVIETRQDNIGAALDKRSKGRFARR